MVSSILAYSRGRTTCHPPPQNEPKSRKTPKFTNMAGEGPKFREKKFQNFFLGPSIHNTTFQRGNPTIPRKSVITVPPLKTIKNEKNNFPFFKKNFRIFKNFQNFWELEFFFLKNGKIFFSFFIVLNPFLGPKNLLKKIFRHPKNFFFDPWKLKTVYFVGAFFWGRPS